MGHFPIHPVFMGILWIGAKLVSANLVALVFGIISTIILYRISKLIFKRGQFWIPVIIFMLFPAVWIINTNLMVESISLTFYLLSVLFLLKRQKPGFILSLFLMIGTHLESIFWIPAIFLIPYIFEIKFGKKEIVKFIESAGFSIIISLAFYLAIYYFRNLSFSGSSEQLMTYFSSGPLRMVRNLWLSFIRGFGSLTPFVLAWLLYKNIKTKKVLVAWVLFFGIVALIGSNWQGDFMIRRIIFAAVILSLAIYKYLEKYSILFILYLIPIIVANGLLYYRYNPNMPLIKMQESIDGLPKNQVLIQTHYLLPFTKYEGTVLWTGGNDLNKIDGYLNKGKRVFLTKETVTAPYQLIVGNNYHITSLGRIGDSESRFLFEKYAVEPYGNSLELKPFKGKASKESGQPVIFYSDSFWGRLARARTDYGDIGTWIWAVTVNHRDPVGWTYKDVRGK